MYDYVIVGAGSAGCALVNRLSADPSVNILLIEAGPSDTNWLIHMPGGNARLLGDRRHSWSYAATPAAGRNEPEYLIGGRMLGGTSSINGQMYGAASPRISMTGKRRGAVVGAGRIWRSISRSWRTTNFSRVIAGEKADLFIFPLKARSSNYARRSSPRRTARAFDPQLRVRGVAGLQVIDCSVMPGLPSGNTNAPAMVLGLRAADIIKNSRTVTAQ